MQSFTENQQLQSQEIYILQYSSASNAANLLQLLFDISNDG